ncbi:MAG: HAD hydrolase family protein [candidate division WS1 bacterium]|jgi:3-deoxy-D-manno-octulosonate 8-phosphate phosphatase (KDO 8-P phosphatase)|nr:HAD hydrolase family protein [candidate division WS1 bacterium]
MTGAQADRVPLPDPVRILLLDIDGVLTDGGMYFSAEGQAMKRFDVKDGLGVVRLAELGFPTAVVSGDRSAISAARCDVLRIGHVVLGRMDKETAVNEVLEMTGIAAESAVYIGDDITDLPALHMVGLGVAVADAVDVVREQADWVTRRPGGHGAVREICDAIIEQIARRES